MIRFGEFSFDSETRQLLRQGRELHVSPKAYELLQILLNERPKALSKATLQERLWPDTFVSEANLTNLIAELRAALGDQPQQPRFVRTVHRFGYAFCGAAADDAVRSQGASLTFALVRGSRSWPLAEGDNIVGREGDGAAWFDSTTVSRRHARIVITGRDAIIQDLGSKNGTFIGDVRLTEPTALADGDRLRLGSLVVTFRASRDSGPTETVAPED